MIAAPSKNWQLAGIWLVVIPFVLFSSMLLAVLPLYATALVLGVATLAVAALVPMNWLMLSILIIGGVVGGSVEYFLGMAQVNWLPFLLSVTAAVRALASYVLSHRPIETHGRIGDRASSYWITVPAVVFIVCLLASAAMNAVPLTQGFAAVKNYLMMWGVFVAFIVIQPSVAGWRAVWKVMFGIALLQFPIVLYQRFFIASKLPTTASSAGFDAINGTFGGGLVGGRSGALAMFICIVIGYLLLLWRERMARGKWVLVGIGCLLPTLFFIETKVVVIWLPLVVLLVFASQVRRNPALSVAALLASIAVTATILVAYRYSYYADVREQSLVDFFIERAGYIFDPERFNPATRELGRTSTLVHWWRELDPGNVVSWVLGFGPGASRGASSLAIGEVAKRYPFFIDISSASVLLWDAGIVGFLAFLSLLGGGVVAGWRLSRTEGIAGEARVQTEAASIALLLIFSSVFYIRDAVDGPIVQFVMFATLSQILVYLWSKNRGASTTTTG